MVFPAPPEAVAPPVEPSARVTHPPKAAAFKVPVTVVKPPTDNPPVADKAESTDNPPVAVRFPEIENVKWEWKEKGTVVEAWDCPGGLRDRNNSTYLGRFGKRKLQELAALGAAELATFTFAWIAEKRAGKGIQ